MQPAWRDVADSMTPVHPFVRLQRLTAWCLALTLALLTSCAGADQPSPGAATTDVSTTLAPDVASAPAPDTAPVAVQILPNAPTPDPTLDSMNRFPAHFGDAPQHAIRDGRPVVLLPPHDPGTDDRPAQTRTSYLTNTQNSLLVLYDTTSEWGWLGELYAMCAVTLASHFGEVVHKPVAQYAPGELLNYAGVIYVGSTFDEPLPVAFLDDVLADQVPVLWIADNLWQLVARSKTFLADYGYSITWFDVSPISKVLYKQANLTRDATNGAGLIQVGSVNPAVVTTLATAVHDDGTTLPWAVQSRKLTYIVENPFSYIGPDDRYIAYCDLLFHVFAPNTPNRHRALVRLEDVNPSQDPEEFRAIVDYLYGEKVPFSIALIPLYRDAWGVFNNDVPQTLHWTDRPAMLAAIKYATQRGATIVMHGYTHQLENYKDPYSGVSADDFEFFMTHIDSFNSVIYDGAVPGDSAQWAIGRIKAGLAELQAAGLQTPTTFEYPHYAGSSVDSKAIRTVLDRAYHRGLFFGGDLGVLPVNPAHSIGLFYPFKVNDVYGWKITPENLGNFEPAAYNNHPPRLPKDLILSAKNNLVIRDGVASFFFHPYYPLSALQEIVAGIKATGYTFVSANAL